MWEREEYIRKIGFTEKEIERQVSRDRKETRRTLREENEQ